MQSLVQPMRRPLAVVLAAFLGLLFLALWFAPKAAAATSFCTTRPGVPCISPINGCAIRLGNGNYAFVEAGDTITKADGTKWVCDAVKGWQRVTRAVPQGGLTQIPVDYLGRGALLQGPPVKVGPDPCDPITIFCPNPV